MGLRLILPAIAIAVIVWVCITAYHKRRVGGTTFRTGSPIDAIRSRDLKALRLVCRGDESRMQRMIEYEIERSPGISNKQACRRAVDRFKRDNR
jgi:hypothetical protein